jgi:hypothetical protein
MDETTIKGILAKYSPPLSPGQIDEIAEAILSEWRKAEKQLKAQLKKKSKSFRVTRSRRG